MKLLKDSDVYIIVEKFKRYPTDAVIEHSYQDIQKVRVKELPGKAFREYKLISNGKIYWRSRKDIYETYAEAVEVAERNADRWDNIWLELMGYKTLRPWRV